MPQQIPVDVIASGARGCTPRKATRSSAAMPICRTTCVPSNRWSTSIATAALGAKIVYNHADLRLMSRRVIESLRGFREVNLFLRGIIPLIGFRSGIVEYEHGARFAGGSKYGMRRMLGLALEGITSFSVLPLRLASLLGLIVFVGAICDS